MLRPSKNPNISPKRCMFGLFDFGGREWIRTTEVVDGRFTVCSLWPLGNSPLFYFSALEARGGAGGRTRTPDLLITNQLLYQLSYTSISTLDYHSIQNSFRQEYFCFLRTSFCPEASMDGRVFCNREKISVPFCLCMYDRAKQALSFYGSIAKSFPKRPPKGLPIKRAQELIGTQ